MNRIRRIAKGCAAIVAVSSLSACIPQVSIPTVAPASTGSFDPISYVNELPYSYRQMEPVMAAFSVVANDRGWSQDEIRSWYLAVWDIALKEAQGCWNVRYGAKFAHHDGRGCVLRRSGRGAAGFGQITSVIMHVPCERAGICTGDQVVASPWNSMSALIALIEDQGVRPWCYSRFARSFHRVACSHPGLDVG